MLAVFRQHAATLIRNRQSIRTLLPGLIFLVMSGAVPQGTAAQPDQAPVINEIMAAPNGADRITGAIPDEDGDYPDWIEIHNPAPDPVDLGGYTLSDKLSRVRPWVFPAPTRIDAGGYLVVFASGKDRAKAGSPLHADFRLSARGEYLALSAPDGWIVDQLDSEFKLAYPAQRPGISYGRTVTGSGYFWPDPLRPGESGPTPGAANHTGFEGLMPEPRFSVERGIKVSPFKLELATDTVDAQIRYTTNGEWPAPGSGAVYTGPIEISRTTAVRAAVYRPGWIVSDTATHTYIFPGMVARQSHDSVVNEKGFPAAWGEIEPDYAMEPGVIDRHSGFTDGLTAIPSISLVVDLDDLFGAEWGIYTHPQQKGVDWERAASVEIIDPAAPAGARDLQVNCGVRIQGGAFRRFNMSLKNSFRLLFKRRYGPSKLRYNLFPDALRAVSEFDTLILRMVSSDGYQWKGMNAAQYARDEFGRRTGRDLGLKTSHGRYVHLYVTGVYWGLYSFVERPDAGFARSYHGVPKDEWDGLNSLRAINESSTQPWDDMIGLLRGISEAQDESGRTRALMQAQGLDATGNDDPSSPDYIDVDNYIDYMLVNWYVENKDWPHRNNYVGRQRDRNDPAAYRSAVDGVSAGFQFLMWDVEATQLLTTVLDQDNARHALAGVGAPHKYLAPSQEYRIRFGDRVHRALFNEGALTAQNCVRRYDEVTRLHTSILVPELARWGDQHGDTHSIENWQIQRDSIRDRWCNWRTDEFVDALRSADPELYPRLDARRTRPTAAHSRPIPGSVWSCPRVQPTFTT